jgi:hypothetical protein
MDNTEKILIVGGIAVAGYLAYSKMDEIKAAISSAASGGGGISLNLTGMTGENLSLQGLAEIISGMSSSSSNLLENLKSGYENVISEYQKTIENIQTTNKDLYDKYLNLLSTGFSFWPTKTDKTTITTTTTNGKEGVGILDFMANLLSGQYFREFGANVSISPFEWGQVIGYKSYEGIGKYAMTGIAAVTGQIKAPEKIPLFSPGGYLDTLTKGISNAPPQSTHTGVSTKTPTSPISLARPPTATEIQSAIKAGTLKLPLDLSKAAVIKK